MKRISLVVCFLAFSAAALTQDALPPEPEAASTVVLDAEPDELTCDIDDGTRGKSPAECKSGCNKQCSGASNKAKCVGTCRRACDGK